MASIAPADGDGDTGTKHSNDTEGARAEATTDRSGAGVEGAVGARPLS